MFFRFDDWIKKNWHRKLSAERFYHEMDLQIDWLEIELSDISFIEMTDFDIDDVMHSYHAAVNSFREVGFSEYVKRREIWKQKSWR